MHIAVAGNIGSGKTTLTKKLAEKYCWEPKFEDVEHNPYLEDFYNDMDRWSFHLQVYFLNSRYQQVLKIRESKQAIIQDRTIYEDAHIFAKNLNAIGHMTNRDYKNYLDLFDCMTQFIQAPDLLIYLKADIPKLQKQISLRGRSYENTIPEDYLTALNVHYNNWIENYKEGKVLVLDANSLDYENNTSDFEYVTSEVESKLKGLFATI
ncbi:deoxynucleoside kinase [Aureibacter tunicatorum]|uniref:Deoxyadenosine/deoxycytidine kinase n=1 Tax=Aureibacter tunicatorum TaxID=866807 RepID=A0AAE4BT36_9BACT|nr:deoxynucleoside kinase [Aureibacter tunicatorum]MDR6239097.1 deoxyadenosine/deoxycytidine kinase [Aureibacter tunicatorum]BDD04977.1 deoxynucleoside kinase [Aureibacter tunicatorum]